MKAYLEEKEQVLQSVHSNQKGLSEEEAEKRLLQYGKNKLKEGKKKTFLQKFIEELINPMILILLAAAVVSGMTAAISGESFADVIIILIVVLINGVLGVVQENKAEKAIEALQEMASATSKVYRNGIEETVKSEELVVGDVILLEAGDAVPADARILESASLKLEEAALTGESVPVNKISEKLNSEEEIPLGDRKNMVYMGSSVAYGRGTAVVTATAMDTEMGKIADVLLTASDSATPLQKKLNQLSKVLSLLVLVICIIIFSVDILRWKDSLTMTGLLDTFMVAVSLAVAAIPEGLAAVVTIVLSIGVTNMSQKNAVIRKLTAVETLGCAEIICSDKTGTLTQNLMTVIEHRGEEKILAKALALCSDAKLDKNHKAIGEPTECALVNYAYSLGLAKEALEEEEARIGEVPFDSVRKMMTTIHKRKDGSIIQYTKGAPDEVVRLCTTILVGGKEIAFTEEKKKEILAENKAMADKALRVLAGAERTLKELPKAMESKEVEHDLCFLGLAGMMDPVREEAGQAVMKCKEAGIRPVMITGDHKDTAVAIGRQLGIIREESEALTGTELDWMDDKTFQEKIEQYSVYARVQPEHKVRIVNGWKEKGKVVAMTGDGVNDAPSIKSAHIGIGMGITGTDVTKNVADMVLLDDNFATIVTAVGEGRRIYDNIRKSIQFLLSSNLSEVLSIFTATLMGFTILKPVHLLWINLITDCFPALALGMEKGEENIMKKKPRSAGVGIFADGLGADVIFQGILVTVITLAAYFVGHFMESGKWEIVNSRDGMTMAFLTLSMTEIFHSFNMRSRRQSIWKIKKQNFYLWGAMAVSFICTTSVIYIPFFASAFDFEVISPGEYAVSLALAFCVIPIMEAVKLFQRRLERSRNDTLRT